MAVWAHARSLIAIFGVCAGPMQGHQESALRLVLGPCKLIDSMVWGQFWAHTRPLAEIFGDRARPMQAHW